MANSIDILIKARDEASKKFGAVGSAVAKMSKSIALVGAGASIAAIALTTKAIKDGLVAYSEQEDAVVKLGKALDILGKKYQTDRFTTFATEMQKITTYGDEAVLELMALGASMGNLSGGELERATKAAIGLAEAYNMDLQAAMTLIAKAAQGNTSALSRYGIQVDENMSQQEKFNYVLEQGIKKFPIATEMTKTYSGAIKQMKNAVGEISEEIGKTFAPVISAMAQNIKSFAEGAVADIIQFVETSKIYFKVFTENWKLVFELGAKSAALYVIGFAMDVKHWFTVALPEYLNWFRDNWKNVFMDIFNGTKAVINNLWTNFKNFFTAVWDWLKGGDFEFAWTPLLDGFKKTAEDLPKIAERSLTAIEQSLLARTNEIKNELANKVQIEIAAVEQKKADAKAKLLADMAKDKSSIAASQPADIFKTSGISSTVESRFLQFAPKNNYYSNMVKYNTETARNTKELKLMPKVVDGLNNIAKLLGGESDYALPAGI